MNVSAVFAKLIYLFLPHHWAFSAVNFLITTVLTLASIELVCQVLKRWVPCLYRLLSGKR